MNSCFIISVVLLLLASASAADNGSIDSTGDHTVLRSLRFSTTAPATQPHDQWELTPMRALPVRREQAWPVRGQAGGGVSLSTLAPAKVGRTHKTQPPLFFHMSRPTTQPIEATLSVEGDPVPVKTWSLQGAGAGFHRLSLRPGDAKLLANARYEWVVAVVLDPQHRSRDIVGRSLIELAAADGPIPDVESYDVIANALEAIGQHPESYRLKLLEVMGLSESDTQLDLKPE